jgi:hypothetical protein
MSTPHPLNDRRQSERRLSQCPSCKSARGIPFRVAEDEHGKLTYTCPECEHEWELDAEL